MIRRRLAPMAERTAISFCRAAARDAHHLRARLFDRDPGLEPADHVDAGVVAAPVRPAELIFKPQQRSPDVGEPPAPVQSRGNDAYHGVGFAVQGDLPAQYV